MKSLSKVNSIALLLCVTLLGSGLGCSQRHGSVSNTGIVGASVGGVVGGFLGDKIGNKQGASELGTLIGGASGALVGLGTGEYLEQGRLDKIRKDSPARRIPVLNKQELSEHIEKERKINAEATKFGNGETKSWEDRYLDSNSNFPYQGQ